MDKIEAKKIIMKIIASNQELIRNYDILLKNKIGYMTNKVREYCDSLDNKYVADNIRYSIANSEEETKTVYKNIVNSKVKARFEESSGKKIPAAVFAMIMNEVLDDMA